MTHQEYLQALGLLTLAKRHYEKVKDCEKALAKLLKVPNDGNQYYGHVSDAIWEGDADLDELIEKLELTAPTV